MRKNAGLQTDTRGVAAAFDELTTERTEEGMSEIPLHQLTERINFGP